LSILSRFVFAGGYQPALGLLMKPTESGGEAVQAACDILAPVRVKVARIYISPLYRIIGSGCV
jgi:hypothetical protein